MDKLRESLLASPVVEKKGYQYFVHPITDGVPGLDPAILREIVVGIIKASDIESADKIVAPEAMGIHIGTALSLAVDKPLNIVRKKSYGFSNEVSVQQVTGYSENNLFINGVERGDRVIVVDDVVSTGGTLSSLYSALLEIDAEIVDAVVVIKKGEEVDIDSSIDYEYLVNVDVVDGEVVLLD